MNIKVVGNESTKQLSFVSFSQNFGSVIIGTETHWKSFKIKSPTRVKIEYEFDHEKEIYLFERLLESNLAAVVFSESSSLLLLFNLKLKQEIAQLDFVNHILAVKLNSKRVVTMTTIELCIYDIHYATHLHTIPLMCGFSMGTLALSNNADLCYAAYPGDCGTIHIFDAVDLHAVSTISAHNSHVAALAFNSQGELLATASERGTVIRIFLVNDSTKLMEFRRGSSAVSIHSLAFSLDSNYLACSSNSRTVHVFKLDADKKKDDEESRRGWLSYLGDALHHSASLLTGDRLLPLKRSFAVAHLPSADLRSTCAIISYQDRPYLLTATTEGWLNIYEIEENGGECVLVNKYKLDEFNRFAEGFQIIDPKTKSLNSDLFLGTGEQFETTSPTVSSEDSCLEYAPVPKPSYANVLMNNYKGDGPRERKEEAKISLKEAANWEENSSSDSDVAVLELSSQEQFPSISDALKRDNAFHFTN